MQSEKRKEYRAKYLKENRDRINAAALAYRIKNREAIRQKQNARYHALDASRRKARGRKNALKRSYGITIEEYNEMLVRQHGVCAICKEPPCKRPLFVDHCHQTKAIRGLLCGRCNSALGFIRDNLTVYINVRNYLWTPWCSQEQIFKEGSS